MKSIPTKAVPPSASVSTGTESAVAAPTIRVLKIASCPSLSGRSSLTYHLGISPDSDIKLRVFANSGGGFFSREWISLKAIQQILEKAYRRQSGRVVFVWRIVCREVGEYDGVHPRHPEAHRTGDAHQGKATLL